MNPVSSAVPARTVPPLDFDDSVQSEFSTRYRTCAPETLLAELDGYAPRSREQREAYEFYRGWALCDAGRYSDSRSHLLVALQGTRRASARRSLIRGLFGESYLRAGRFAHAERCVRRAI